MKGRIKALRDSFGFIATDEKVELFFHRDDVVDDFDLKEGDLVTFEAVDPPPPQGPRACNVAFLAAGSTMELGHTVRPDTPDTVRLGKNKGGRTQGGSLEPLSGPLSDQGREKAPTGHCACGELDWNATDAGWRCSGCGQVVRR